MGAILMENLGGQLGVRNHCSYRGDAGVKFYKYRFPVVR